MIGGQPDSIPTGKATADKKELCIKKVENSWLGDRKKRGKN